jgi:hypothetical protein
VSFSLANGMGDEGVMKTEMARQIARQAAPEYAVAAAHARDEALAAAAGSEKVRAALGLSDRGVVPVAAEQPRRAVVTLKGGEKVEGTVTREDADWIHLATPTGEVSIRKANADRIDRPSGKQP